MSTLVSIDELAAQLKVNTSWIYDRTRRNEIPCIRVGKYLRFNVEEVLRWLKTNQECSLKTKSQKRGP